MLEDDKDDNDSNKDASSKDNVLKGCEQERSRDKNILKMKE